MKTPLRFLLIASLSTGLLPAQQPAPQGAPPSETADPFAPRNPGNADNGPRMVNVRFEVFSLEKNAAAALLRQGSVDEPLYQEILKRLAKGEATQEVLTQVRARSGEKALTEAVSEIIYPVECMHGNGPTPSQPPGSNGARPTGNGDASNYIAPVLPTSFETRNTGMTLEIEPTLGANNQVVDLRFMPSLVKLAGYTKASRGVSETQMPLFETQQIHTACTTFDGKPYFCGTFTPPPNAKTTPNANTHLRLAFVTCDVVRP